MGGVARPECAGGKPAARSVESPRRERPPLRAREPGQDGSEGPSDLILADGPDVPAVERSFRVRRVGPVFVRTEDVRADGGGRDGAAVRVTRPRAAER